MDIQDHFTQFVNNPTIISDGSFIVLTGTNNSGKSTVLRSICRGTPGASLVNSHRTLISGEGPINESYEANHENYASTTRDANDDNHSKPIQVLQEFFILGDEQRQAVIDYYNAYFPNRIYEERKDSTNCASSMRLMMNGFPLTLQGTGARAILEILIRLADPKIKLLCIDEPELALEPRLQKSLYRAIKARTPEKKIILATHSHHFLDKESIENNYVCSRDGNNKVSLTQVSSPEDLREQTFRLLGNELSDLELPEAILIVEGVSDVDFINKALKFLGKSKYTPIAAGSSSKIGTAIQAITQFVKFSIGKGSVYGDRTWVVADSRVPDRDIREWKVKLGQNDRVKILPKNGIEYFYPPRVLQEIFNTNSPLDEIVVDYLKNGEHSGKKYSKPELARLVAQKMNEADIRDTTNELFIFLASLPE